MRAIPLSILEFGYIKPPELYAYQVINSLFEEISRYEGFGYKRYWLSEHYSYEFAWHNPEMLIPLLAGYTEKIKIGLAGILLSFHSPLRVAQNFKLLSSIYNDRIDLGIARAYVPEHIGKYLIPESELQNGALNWEVKLEELFRFLNDFDPENSLIKKLIVPPHGTSLPQTWFLGTSDFSLANAVKYQSNLCLSFMHPGSSFERNKDVIKIFKEKYYKRHHQLPTTSVLISCAVLKPGDRLDTLNRQYNHLETVNPFGTGEYIAEQMERIQEIIENDEFVLFCPLVNREERLASYESIMVCWKKKNENEPATLLT